MQHDTNVIFLQKSSLWSVIGQIKHTGDTMLDKKEQCVKEILESFDEMDIFKKNMDMMLEEEECHTVKLKSLYLAEVLYTKIFNIINSK